MKKKRHKNCRHPIPVHPTTPPTPPFHRHSPPRTPTPVSSASTLCPATVRTDPTPSRSSSLTAFASSLQYVTTPPPLRPHQNPPPPPPPQGMESIDEEKLQRAKETLKINCLLMEDGTSTTVDSLGGLMVRNYYFSCFALTLSPPCTQHNTTQHNTTQHNTTQHNTTQHNTTQHNTTQHNTTQHNTTQHNTTQHNTTQHNTTQHNTTQHNNTTACTRP